MSSVNEGENSDLDRFVHAQESTFTTALAELRASRKTSHWMWFIFPQIEGLGSSATARRFALNGVNEARAFLRHPMLGPRLLECCRALLSVDGRSVSEILGYPDDLKLKSSMTIFALADPAVPEFGQVLEKYFRGERDQRTIELANTAI